MCSARARLWFRYKRCTLQPWYLRKHLSWKNVQILELRTCPLMIHPHNPGGSTNTFVFSRGRSGKGFVSFSVRKKRQKEEQGALWLLVVPTMRAPTTGH
jgi:hypothetical protein